MRFVLLVLLLATSQAEARKRVQPRAARPVAVAPAPDPATAHSAFIRGDYIQATALYSQVLASSRLTTAQREPILLNRGYAYLRMNRDAEAMADLRQAVALDPGDADAANALSVLQNRAALGKVAAATGAQAAHGWGLLARLPGRRWILSGKKALMHVRFEWSKVGISMAFGGKDAKGNRIEGQYTIDPGLNAIRATYTYRGKVVLSQIEVAPDRFVETVPAKAGERQVTQLQSDGNLLVTSQKMKSKAWQTDTRQTLVPASEDMIASLNWPEVAEPRESFGKGLLRSMKEGALAGFRDGMTQGLTDATAYRVRQVTDTKLCKTVTGEAVKCP
jgi:tetratricopeptide (TPR) repeat protein